MNQGEREPGELDPAGAGVSPTFLTASGAAPSTPGSVIVEVVEGPHAGRSFEFSKHESLVVGRSESCQLRIEDDHHFSRFHFRLEINPPAARLIDLDSRNGTRVNGKRVRSAELHEGDEIAAGRTRLRIRLHVARADRRYEPTILGPVDPGEPAQPLARPTVVPQGSLSIPGYEVQEELGRGALGVVYRALHKATRRPVAVKLVLPTRAMDSQTTQLFLREATILSQLRHPRIVEFHEFGIAAQQMFYVMEFIDHQSPDSLWERMAWDRRVRVACGIVCQVLEGLEFAHERSFVHRDVKPANILMLRTGRKLNVKVSDFGMAKNYQYAGFSDLTDDRDARGSLAFMAPEQVINCRFARPSCDIYAVGVTLYKYLSGELPFDFNSERSALAAILDGEPVRIESRCPGVTRELASHVHRALAKDATVRFPSAKEMRAALLPFAKGS